MSSTQASCCDLTVKGLDHMLDDKICDECHKRIEEYYEELQLEWAMEDYYERKYGNGSKD